MDFKPFKIGKYLLLERLATGGMAEVYRAKASGAGGFEKQLAIKRILPNYSENEEFRRMFEYEARLSSMLTHANIVQVYDFVKSGETYLLAMEYVDGKNLRQFVNKSKKAGFQPPVEFCVYVINEVCKGLEYAHKKKDDLTGKSLNIIHRDMSPQNIMLSYEGAVKIVDFGIAKAKDRVDETRSGVIKGKFGYMSPEQANGETVDGRTDIFSTGIILYEMLTGRRLFAAESDMATLRQIQECAVPTPSRINPKITAELEKILLKVLTKDMSLRYQDAGLFHRALVEYLAKHFPSFTQREVAEVLQRTFREEIEKEKKRFEQVYRQSIPFSQGQARPEENSESEDDALAEVENALEDSLTRSEIGAKTAVTAAEIEDDSEPDSLLSPEISQISMPSGLVDASGVNISAAGDTEKSSETKNDYPDAEPEERMSSLQLEKNSIHDRILTSSRSKSLLSFEGSSATQKDPATKGVSQSLQRFENTGVTGEETVYEMPVAGQGKAPEKKSTELPEPPTPADPPSRAEGPAAIKLNRPRTETSHSRGGSRSEIRRGSDRLEPGPSFEFGESLDRSRPSGLRVDPLAIPVKSGYHDREREPAPRKNRRLFHPAITVILIGGLTAYAYKLYLDGQIPVLIEMLQASKSAVTESAHPPEEKPVPRTAASSAANVARPVADCSVEIDSDPRGADVILNQAKAGVTPATVSYACNMSVNVTLQLEGYEADSQNVVMKGQTQNLYRTLKKIPMGYLELTVNQIAQVYINGDWVGEASPKKRFEKPLRANRRYQIKLVNKLLGEETTADVGIEENAVTRRALSLSTPRHPTATRPRAGRR